MELDDFKTVTGKMKNGSGIKDVNGSGPASSITGLFRTEEDKNRKKSIAWAVVLVSMSVVYFSRMGSREGLFAAGMVILGAGFIMGALYTWISSKKLPDNIYMLPPVEFLNIAERRLQYIPPREMLKILPILMILGVGGGLVFTTSIIKYTSNSTLVIAIWIVFYISLCTFGYFAGRSKWRKQYGDLLKQISEIRRELQ